MKITHILIHICIVIALISCDRDTLYYATDERALVRFNVDWSQSDLHPNGVSAYVFDHNTGDAVGKCVISSNSNVIDVALPMGLYDVLIFNDTESELDNIEFTDVQNLSTFKAMITTKDDSNYKINLTKAKSLYATACDIVASAITRSIEISRQDIDYYPERPKVGQNELVREVTVVPQRLTELIDIEVEVMNINSAAGAPRSLLTDISQGNHVGLSTKFSGLVTHEFVLNNRTIDPNNYKLGKINKKFISFGVQSKENKLLPNHTLAMDFVLVNGEKHLVEIDVTHSIRTYYDKTQSVHEIRSTIVLPEAIGNGGGAFNPDIEEWDDIEVELPI